MHYIYEYDIAAVFITLAVMINFYRKKTLNTKITIIFTLILLIVGISSASDALGSYIIMNPTRFPMWVNNLIIIIYFSTHNAIPFIYFTSFFFSTDLYKLNKYIHRFFIIPYIIAFILIIISPFANTIFYFDEALNYHHGFFFSLLYVIGAIYLVASIVVTKVFGRYFTPEQKKSVVFYTVVCMVGILIQAIYTNLMIVDFLSAISALIIYLSLENPSNYVDKEMNFYNKAALSYTVRQNLETNHAFTVVAFQVMGLNYLNDVLGAKSKNQILHYLSDLLLMISKKGNIYRFSSNKFVFVIKKDEEKKNQLIKKLQLAFEEPLRVSDTTIPLTLRITYFDCPDDVDSIENVMDLIEFSLKQLSVNDTETVQRADKSLLQKRRREKYIVNTLKKACENSDFEMLYQPVYSLKDDKIIGIDTKISFKNPELKMVPSREFIPLAEKHGLIPSLENFILDTVFSFIKKNDLKNKGIETVYLNLSAVQCMQEQLSYNILEKMERNNIDPKLINLTITDETVINSNEILQNSMNKMIANGLSFSLGNFGNGFSNTYSLIKYPFRDVKLSKSIIGNMNEDKNGINVFIHLLKMIKALDMRVIANGIETEEQYKLSKEIECDFVKGNYCSKSLTEAEFIKLLEEV